MSGWRKRNIMEMAKESGFIDADWNYTIIVPYLEAFAALVREDEREKILDMCKEGLWDAEGIQHHLSKGTSMTEEAKIIYGLNKDDWKDIVDAIAKVRDGRGIYLACKPADVLQDWFLALGAAKIKEKSNATTKTTRTA